MGTGPARDLDHGHDDPFLWSLLEDLFSAAGALLLATEVQADDGPDVPSDRVRLQQDLDRLVEVLSSLAESLTAHRSAAGRLWPGATAPQPLAEAAAVLGHAAVVVDKAAHVAVLHGVPVTLPLQEFRLLALLASRSHQLVTHQEMAGFGRSPRQARMTVRSYIHRLRRRIEPDSGRPTHLVTVAHAGYRLDPCGRPRCGPTVPQVATSCSPSFHPEVKPAS